MCKKDEKKRTFTIAEEKLSYTYDLTTQYLTLSNRKKKAVY